jgi:hypothetical protein
MSIDSRVTNTGPIGATMSAMELDMSGPGGVFGRLALPEVQAKSSGTDVIVTNQTIQITNMEAFIAFTKAIMCDEALVLRLENGNATVKAFLLTANIIYAKNVHMKGMNGPRTTMLKTEILDGGKEVRNTMRAVNPSPLEIDLGTVRYEIRNGKGVKIAEQKGKIYFGRGETEYVTTAIVTGVAAEGDARIIGLGVEEDNWNNETIPFLDAPVTLTGEFVALCKRSRNSEKGE